MARRCAWENPAEYRPYSRPEPIFIRSRPDDSTRGQENRDPCPRAVSIRRGGVLQSDRRVERNAIAKQQYARKRSPLLILASIKSVKRRPPGETHLDRATAPKFPGIRAVFDDNTEC